TLMPFSSAIVGEYPQLVFSQTFYSGNMIMLALGALLQNRHVHRHPSLWSAPVTLGFYRAARFRSFGLVVVAGVAIGLTWLLPSTGNVAFLLMIPITILSRRIESAASR